jgi:hypothetical protein
MKRSCPALMLALVLGAAAATPPELPPPARPLPTPRRQVLAPLDFFYRPLASERVNVGANGRLNATAAESREAMTPSLQLRPLGW